MTEAASPPVLIYEGAVSRGSKGGAEGHFRALADELRSGASEFRVIVVIPSFHGEGSVDVSGPAANVVALRVPRRGPIGHLTYELRKALWYLRRRLHTRDPGTVIARISPVGVASVLASWLGYHVLMEVNGLPADELRMRSIGRARVALASAVVDAQLRTATGAICVTEGLADEVRRRGVRNVVRIENATGHIASDEVRMAPGEPNSVVYSGVFAPWQELDTLIRAFAMLVEQEPSRGWSMTLVGDGESRPGIDLLIRSLDLGKHVAVTGWLDAGTARQIVASHQIAVAPLKPKSASGACGSPLKVFEYLALGRTVVGSTVDGNLELADLGVLLYRVGDVEHLAATLMEARNTVQSGLVGLVEREALGWADRARRVLAFVEAVR